MKIALFVDTYFPHLNGVTVAVNNAVEQLRKKGHTVYIIVPSIKGAKKKEKDVYRLSSIKILSSEPEQRMPLFMPNKSMREVFALDFDVVHAHGNGMFSILGYEIAKMKGVPYILTFHTVHTDYTHYIFDGKVVTSEMIEKIFKVYGNLCDGVIAPSNKMKQILQKYGVKRDIKVLPGFIESEKFTSKSTQFLHKKLSISESDPIVLTVGRLGKEKKFAFTINMFKRLLQYIPQAHLVIVGKGPEKESLLQLTESLGIEKNVHFTGQISKKFMPQVYADASVFVFASDTETQGICVLEAAASGLPLVVAKDKAYENIVQNNINGYTVPLIQKQFVEKTVHILQNSSLREAMSNKSRELAHKNFKGETITNQLIAYYEYVVHNHSSHVARIRKVNRNTLLKLQKATAFVERFLNMEL